MVAHKRVSGHHWSFKCCHCRVIHKVVYLARHMLYDGIFNNDFLSDLLTVNAENR